MSYERRDVVGGAVATTLAVGINATAISFSIAATTGWPSGTAGDFFVVIGRGTATEEKLRCTSRTGAVVSVPLANRGADGTSAQAHQAGDTVEICGTALDDDEANYAVAGTVGKITAAGQILVADGVNSFAAVQGKTSGQVLMGNGTTVVSQALTGDVTVDGSGVTAIGANKITNAMMADNAIGTAEIAASPTLTTPNIGVATGTSLAVSGKVTSSGTAGVGYAAGAGGTQTQATDKSTGVTLNKVSGQITLNNASLAAGASVSFTLTNSVLISSDLLLLNQATGTLGAYALACQMSGNGAAIINVRNLTAGPLAEAFIISFAVIKGAVN